MENVTLTQREQARLKVLNSLLAEQMTLEQAATLMGASATRGEFWRLIERRGPPLLLTVIADAEHPTPHRRR